MTLTLSNSETPDNANHPVCKLPREDLDLIAELVLQSGSLKGLAASYSVSYPTIRGRVDKTIGRLRDLVEGTTPDPVSALLADLVDRGELSPAGARRLRETVRSIGGDQEQTQL